MSLLGLDIGSGSCKGVVFDYDGNIIAEDSEGYKTYSPLPNMVEIDAEVFWKAVVNVTRLLAIKTSNDPIQALAISSHGETVIPIDKYGNAIAPAIMNSDNRAVEQSNWWNKTLGRDKIYSVTGLPLHPMFSINKVMWLKENKPEVYSNAYKFVSVEDYILVKMGLPPYTDYSLACRTMIFDINKKKWSEDILKGAGISEDKLGILLQSGEKAGSLSGEVASILGLREGTIVAMGGHDQPCGALGSGVINSGEVSDSTGTYECLVAVSDNPGNTDKALSYSLNSYCHVVPDKYVTLAFFPAGLVCRWFVEQFCAEDKLIAENSNKTIFEILAKKVEDICAGPTGLCITPHFIGSCNPYWDVRATGIIAGLTPLITKYHIYKAIYEGIACELSINVSALEEIIGKFDTIKTNGGNIKSSFSVNLRADITGKKIQTLNTTEAVCHGAAMLAGVAAGVYKNAEDAVLKTVKTNKLVAPDLEMMKKYEKQIQKYKLLYPSLEVLRNLN